MASKYLSIEETVEFLGIPQAEVNRLRGTGELRGFADRGTWKFRAEDVEEFARSRQADSSVDGGLGGDDPSLEDEDFETTGTTSLLDDDDGVMADQPTLVQQSLDDEPLLVDDTSDSDVRLVIDPSLELDDSSDDDDVQLVVGDEPAVADMNESDSDVRLIANSVESDDAPILSVDDDAPILSVDDDAPILSVDDDAPILSEDDDAPILVEDDDAPILVEDDDAPILVEDDDAPILVVDDDAPVMAESDSEVRLVADPVTEDPGMAGSDSDVKLVASDALEATMLETPRAVEDLDMTEIAEGSGVSLEPAADSGISLETVAESGISLEVGDESGISLESSGSGVDLGDVTIADSGISLDLDSETADETQVEVPAMVDDGTDFEMAGADDEEADTDTSVLLFDDEEDADDYSATVVKKSADHDDIFDEFTDIGGDDDLDEVDDDIFGDDDELGGDLDVFDADDDVFDDEEAEDYAVPVEQRIVAAVEHEWGVGTFLAMMFSTGLMVFCGMVMFELVKSIWGWQDPTPITGGLIDAVGGLFN